MTERQKNTYDPEIYLAPLQGFTDFVYRSCFAKIFSDVDAYFIPYVSVKNKVILKKHMKEILPENNLHSRVIPQVLVKDANEIIFLAEMLKNLGYKEINLNLGCPYPMVTNQGQGAGILPKPDLLAKILHGFFENADLKLSVKLRAGLNSVDELKSIIPVLNRFPLTEIILHPRIAKQLYSGKVFNDAFHYAKLHLKHLLVYNGDIFSFDDYNIRKKIFPKTNKWMLGRGILMNPFLPAEINNIVISNEEKAMKLYEFHQMLFNKYAEVMDNEGNVLNKMKQFWHYIKYNFPDREKYFRRIKKVKSIPNYQMVVEQIFKESD